MKVVVVTCRTKLAATLPFSDKKGEKCKAFEHYEMEGTKHSEFFCALNERERNLSKNEGAGRNSRRILFATVNATMVSGNLIYSACLTDANLFCFFKNLFLF